MLDPIKQGFREVRRRLMLDKVKRVIARSNYVFFGCDPEFFFSKGGKVIGAEKVVPEGLQSDVYGVKKKAFVLDGVQVELNPSPHSCRQGMGGEIALAFKNLKAHLEKLGDKEIKADFSSVITLDKEELDSLSEQAKKFGCAPSLNSYSSSAKLKDVDASVYLKRAAGGHLHLGLQGGIMVQRVRLVPILDILLGNTCVLIDLDPGQVERRKHYGRAGEYRLPNHGLEYRTLSNFWLRSYPLMSFVMGIARLSNNVLDTTIMFEKYGTNADPFQVYNGGSIFDAEKELLSRVDLKKVAKAINTNNLKLAQENWEGVKDFIMSFVPASSAGLDSALLPDFEDFAKIVQEDKRGLSYFFPDDPMTHWAGPDYPVRGGWESWIVGDGRGMINSWKKKHKG